ncbi:unnamed protein product [Spirodela intermedia]|uniref:Uncharacterized protein n=1 Tax=Spirodela intermedia TaxID=51605 RepID=A0A7I8LLD5_SPIIN|nr:unnamed protein product [Spirodela intermedia]
MVCGGSLLNKYDDEVEELIEQLVENDNHHIWLIQNERNVGPKRGRVLNVKSMESEIERDMTDRHVEQLKADVESLNQVDSNVENMKGKGKEVNFLLELQFVDGSIKQPYGVLKDVMIKIEHCTFLVDFISRAPIVLGKPFLTTAKAITD